MYVVDLTFFLGLVAVTTLVAGTAVRMFHPAPARSMGQAVRALVDWAGMFAIFFGANTALGAVVILLFRGITPHFVPVYKLENIHLLVLSAAQAFIFQKLWKSE